jgi:hypothetical protein
MKKIIKLTESDLARIVKRIIKEQGREDEDDEYYDEDDNTVDGIVTKWETRTDNSFYVSFADRFNTLTDYKNAMREYDHDYEDMIESEVGGYPGDDMYKPFLRELKKSDDWNM